MLVKLLILIPILWMLAMFVVNLNDDSSRTSQLLAEKEELSRKNDLMKKVLEQHEDEKRHRSDNSVNPLNAQKEDHDHPEEERQKAQKQIQEKAGAVQVHAPDEKNNKNNNAPGELGKPVIIDKEKLSPEERKKYDQGWKNNAFNQYASDMISLHRTLADIRDPECKAVKWYDPLPTTSVIVIFHNEAWSVLLRTVHSVIDRSDPKILKEVIVVDDFSDFRN
jgi:polypeptide N-acetylgalactosaminyltransferase